MCLIGKLSLLYVARKFDWKRIKELDTEILLLKKMKMTLSQVLHKILDFLELEEYFFKRLETLSLVWLDRKALYFVYNKEELVEHDGGKRNFIVKTLL